MGRTAIRVPVLGLLLALSGCAASVAELRSQAAIDLDCPAAQIQIDETVDNFQRVRGCDLEILYESRCTIGSKCKWHMAETILK